MKILSRFFDRLLKRKPSPVKTVNQKVLPRRRRLPELEVKPGSLVDRMRQQYAHELARDRVERIWISDKKVGVK